MTTTGPGLVALSSLGHEAWAEPLRDLLQAVLDVARRLDQNVVAPEHLMVVGAENGVEEMAGEVGSLSTFREHLLEGLFEQRADFRRWGPEGSGQVFLEPELASAFQSMRGGEGARALMVQTMLGGRPLIRRALQGARAGPTAAPASGAPTSDGPGAAAGAAAAPDAAQAQAEQLMARLLTDLSSDAASAPPLVGREELTELVARSLLRLSRPVVLLVGVPGAGKTAFLRGLAGAAARGELEPLAGLRFHQLELAELLSLGHRGADLHRVVERLLQRVAADPDGVLVVDDVHLLVARQGTPLLSDVLDTLRLRLMQDGLRALLTVDAEMFARAFAQDPFFAGEVTLTELPPPGRDDLLLILEQLRPRLEAHFGLAVDPPAVAAAVDAGLALYDGDVAPPGICARLLDEACTLARTRGEPRVLASHVVQAENVAPEGLDRRRLAGLEKALAERVQGQPGAVAAVARRVRLAKQKLDRHPERPDGVFLFVGPSGAGKVELARALAYALYDDATRLLRLDLGEATEPWAAARLVGLPSPQVEEPGEGTLTGPVTRMGHGVVLLEKIEKAHPGVLDLLGQVFERGRLTDGAGHEVRFSDTVVILTSSIGRDLYAIHSEPTIGFDTSEPDAPDQPLRDAVLQQLLRVLPPEFVNRIDEIVPFRVLDDADIHRIAERLLALEAQRWASRGKVMTFTPDVAELIATTGYDARLGARHVERNLERFVIALMGDAAVTEGFEAVRAVHVDAKEGRICLDLDGTPFECLDREGP